MGHTKESAGVDLEIGPMPLTQEDRQAVSDIIAQYKRTGKMPPVVHKSKTGEKKKKATAKGVEHRPANPE